ncbi:hypothetical protein D1013_13135 [Euzebyella marina]|uniref:Aerotolerance regulator N-terminal domain-containing protein n=1 Tax=Euzebyella marina TaxID=1761453 RepID=A0A3G2L7L7_9FLAO|nr:BatA domain-containing protein [Euzebyella marina]AYN68252.1 hypothetical protein D1013_13135 [Euzebyella marina]
MQFKHPELLWALFLLLIPIFIHLFQLRRFQKTPFTNVKLLKKVVVESRRSQTLKKWLLLLTRLSLLAALVIAFAQPFFASKVALKEKETIIYLDNSFSMQLKNNGASLLQNAVQQLLKVLPKNERITIFTNDRTFRNVLLQDFQNQLLEINFTDEQLTLNQIQFKGETLFSENSDTDKNLVIVSDFQRSLQFNGSDSLSTVKKHLVQLSGDSKNNVSVDSAYIKTNDENHLDLNVLLSAKEELESIPVSLYNDTILTAKSSAKFDENLSGSIQFTITNFEEFKGKIQITDNALDYDNQLYFSIGERQKIKVLAVSDADDSFLKRLFSDDEFELTAVSINQLNYSDISRQNFIIFNELTSIPSPLVSSIKEFTNDGGHLLVIPPIEIDLQSYQVLTSQFYGTAFGEKNASEKNITQINFAHPLYQNVFDKKVDNFQYPKTSSQYTLKSAAPSILRFQDRTPFLIGDNNFYAFSAPLSSENSNFKNSPLIVPTFYNMAINSLKSPELYNQLRKDVFVDVPISLEQDGILKVVKGEIEYIPQQQSMAQKVHMVFNDELNEDGIYSIDYQNKSLGLLSFNYDRKESMLEYLHPEELESTSLDTSITSLFETFEKDNRVTELWKWFVILALLFLMVEILIQKFLK